VVLKYLATIQIFLERTTAEEGEMHIGRANLICNANLHRAAIKKRLFLYAFTTKKKGEPAPIVKQQPPERNKEERKRFGTTDIFVLGENDDDEGYQYIPGKVHADMMEAIIGIFYLKNKRLNDCQTLLYAFGILRRPTLLIDFAGSDPIAYDLPQCYTDLEQRLSYSFRHKGLLVQALTHPSFLEYIEDSLDENHSFSRLLSEAKQDEGRSLSLLGSEASFDNIVKVKKQEAFYERLEFLGDAFLDLLVVEYLYDKGGDYINDEGTLSFLKQSAVSNKTLGFIALRLGLHDLILMNLSDIDATLKEFRFLNKSMKGLPSPL
jgi:dsRNA-specific ribonuclease